MRPQTDQMFAPISPARRSPLGVAFSALLHVAAALAGLWVADVGAFEPPRPRAASITFLVVPSEVPELPLLHERPLTAVRQPVVDADPIAAAAPSEPPAPAPVGGPDHADAVDARAAVMPPDPAAAVPAPRGEPPPPVPAAPVVSVGAFDAATAAIRSRAAGVVLGVQLQSARPSAASPPPDVTAVRPAEFDRKAAAPRAAVAAVGQEAPDVPVVVIFKPTPDYTDEARALRIQGDVIVEVEFSAEEQVRVLRVVRGLGHGLDESAARAAARIRFRPARRAGRPIGVLTVVHIVFRLA